MGKRYTNEERREALKLADEIGPAAAARRLGINTDTLYGWRSREKERTAALEAAVGGWSEAELLTEIKALREQLKQARQDVEILQESLVFFAKCRRPCVPAVSIASSAPIRVAGRYPFCAGY